MLAYHILLVEGCARKFAENYANRIRKGKPCTDIRRQKIRVGRNPVRYVTVDDYGAHGECDNDDECLPKIKCTEGCCL
ncbi:hypothetical protein ACH3XW_36655 [Acanthocheilonema viteae]|uniref:Uncharacterized protein n=1 Tax=Acanthocheilonema viteae TaxID=6277 RepID=A0A498SRT5_ACAVI|nr:unnamed protein product [Acanthocheilonema viteae]